MRQYELGVVLRADLSEAERTGQLETLQTWVESAGGKVVEVDHWGRRRLAYPINKQRDGYYLFYTLELPPNAPVDLERNMTIAENFLRYLITRKEV